MATINKRAVAGLAKSPGLQPVLQSAAEGIRDRAAALAAQTSRSGRYAGSFEVREDKHKSGVVDRVVESTDPGGLAIEVGYVATRKDGSPGEVVPGKHTLSRAVG